MKIFLILLLLFLFLLSIMSMKWNSFQYVVLMIPVILVIFCCLFIQRLTSFKCLKSKKIYKNQEDIVYLELWKLCKVIAMRQGRPWMIEELAIGMLKSEDDIRKEIILGKKLKKIQVSWMIHPRTNDEYPAIFLTQMGKDWIGMNEEGYTKYIDVYSLDVNPTLRSVYPSVGVVQDKENTIRKMKPRGMKRRGVLK